MQAERISGSRDIGIDARKEIEFALERVLTSSTFARASMLRRLLEYVVRETLAGRGARLKEMTLGIAVLQRGADFDPRIDTIVRVTAIKLRQRLQDYYRGEGAIDPVMIAMPKGSYRPTFRLHDDAPLPILDDPEAIFWQAQAIYAQLSPEALSRARRLLTAATARFPHDARLHALLARVAAASTCSYMECMDPDEGVPLMRWAASRAVALDPARTDGELFTRLGDLRRTNKAELLGIMRRTLAEAPQEAGLHQWASAILLSAGKPLEALLHMRCAIGLQPGVLSFRTFAAAVLLYAGRSDEAIRHLEDILACDPENYGASYWLSRAHCAVGDFDAAGDVATRAHAASDTAKSLANLGNVEAFRGNQEAVDGIVGELDKRRARNEYVPRSGLVAIHIANGRLDRAALEAKAAAGEGDFRLAWIKGDPLWAPLRGKVRGV